MQFDLDAEQQLLADSVGRFIENEYGFETRARRLAQGDAPGAAIWRIFADNGWLAAALPEAHGGLGGSILETVIIARHFGRGLVVEPFMGCAVLAAQTLAAAGSEAQLQMWLPRLADGTCRLALAWSDAAQPHVATRADSDGQGYRLTGRKMLVLGGSDADGYIVSAETGAAGAGGTSLFLVPASADGLTITRVPLHDGQVAAELVLDAVAGELLGSAGQGEAALDEGFAHAIIAQASEQVGAMERAIEITADYLRNRQQFGTPLAGFQVLQHRMADMVTELELARSMLFAALISFQNDPPAVRTARLGAAKFFISHAALNVCGESIQLHGGIGMTDEYSVGHYFKRAVVGSVLVGANADHEARCAAALTLRWGVSR